MEMSDISNKKEENQESHTMPRMNIEQRAHTPATWRYFDERTMLTALCKGV